MSKPFGLTHSVTLFKMSRPAALGVLATLALLVNIATSSQISLRASPSVRFMAGEYFLGVGEAQCAMRRDRMRNSRLVTAYGGDNDRPRLRRGR